MALRHLLFLLSSCRSPAIPPPPQFKPDNMCIFELTTYLECDHTWLSHVEPCADDGCVGKCQPTHKPFLLVDKFCCSCENKKEMAKQDKVDPSLELAQSVYDNLALPKAMFETRSRRYTESELQYLVSLRKKVKTDYNVKWGAETDDTEPTSPGLPGNFSSASTLLDAPQHQSPNFPGPQGLTSSGGMSWGPNVNVI